MSAPRRPQPNPRRDPNYRRHVGPHLVHNEVELGTNGPRIIPSEHEAKSERWVNIVAGGIVALAMVIAALMVTAIVTGLIWVISKTT